MYHQAAEAEAAAGSSRSSKKEEGRAAEAAAGAAASSSSICNFSAIKRRNDTHESFWNSCHKLIHIYQMIYSDFETTIPRFPILH